VNCALRVFHGAARVALAEADALGMSDPLAAFRNYARLEGISTTDATAATEQPQVAQAELDRLTAPDQGLRVASTDRTCSATGSN